MNRLPAIGLLSLLATSALVAPAHAELEVTVGGYLLVQAALFDNDSANASHRDFRTETDINVNASGKADNGLEYGALIELLASPSNTINADEANVYLAGNWGRLELGDQDGAGSELAVVAPYVGIGQALGTYTGFVPAADLGQTAARSAGDTPVKAIDTSDATKVTYYIPRFNGFQAGISYAPERDSFAHGEEVQFSRTTGKHDNAVELGANYATTLSGVNVKLGGEYVGSSAKSGSGLEDIRAWEAGGQLGYAGFTVGGGYIHNGDSGLPVGTANDSVNGWNAGVTYANGPWGVGLNYVDIDLDQTGTPFGNSSATGAGGSYRVVGVGGAYKLAPGLSAGADLAFYDRNRVTGADTNGYVLITQVKTAF